MNTSIPTDRCLNCQALYRERVSVLECPSCGSLGPLKSILLKPEVEGVIRSALAKHREGQDKYGVFDPETDTRDIFVEIEEDLLDTINYACYQVLKIRSMRERIVNEQPTYHDPIR